MLDYDIVAGPKYKDVCNHGANNYLCTVFIDRHYDLHKYSYTGQVDGICARYGSNNGEQENYVIDRIRERRSLLWQCVAQICRERGLL